MYYDRLLTPDGSAVPVKVRSMVGIIPMLAAAVADEQMLDRALMISKQFAGYAQRRGLHDREKLQETGLMRGEPGSQRLLLSVVGIDRLEKLFTKMFDESEFLSPYGLRALSAYHRDHPYELDVEGFNATIDYEPAESTTDMFGGNSNWRGPLWFPLNYLICASLERYARFFGDDLTFEYPTGSGQQKPLADIVNDLQSRLISIFLTGADGRRPVLWLGGPAAARPGLEGQPDVQRVLPRRQCGRARRVAPDRLDRGGRRPDPAAARGHPPGRRHRPRAARAGQAMTAVASGPALDELPGSAFPLGATPGQGGTNFAVATGVADAVTLCLFDDAGRETQIPLRDYDAGVWHGFVPGVGPGQAYGYRVAGPYDPARGLFCNPAKLLLDPYAKAISGEVAFGPEVLGYTVG